MAIDYNSQERGQQAMSLAFQDALTENATLRIQGKSKDLLIQEQRSEIARLSGKLEEAGIAVEDKPAEPDKPAAKPRANRRTRRAAPKKTPPKANGKADQPEPPAA